MDFPKRACTQTDNGSSLASVLHHSQLVYTALGNCDAHILTKRCLCSSSNPMY